MKKIFFALFLFAASAIITNQLQAQVSINVNIGNQPAWAPEGNDDAQYYYIPDADIYYDVPAHQFVYLSNGRWVRATTLPTAYRKFDLYKVHKVVINEKNAYLHHDVHVKEYAPFKGKYDQTPIRDSREERYASNKNNWKNNRFQNGNKGQANHPSKGGKH
jgi:hypothetical protein